MTELKVTSKKYNDKDVLEVSNFEEESAKEVNKVIEGASAGTINNVLGLNSNGKLVKGAVSGGSKLYYHRVAVVPSRYELYVITNYPNVIDTANKLRQLITTGLLESSKSYFAFKVVSYYSSQGNVVGVDSGTNTLYIQSFVTSTTQPSITSIVGNQTYTDTIRDL